MLNKWSQGNWVFFIFHLRTLKEKFLITMLCLSTGVELNNLPLPSGPSWTLSYMVRFWHWHIPTFIITDISPPWWDFVMVGICWVTIIMIVMIIVIMILLIQICACGSPRCCSTEWNHSVKPRSTSKDNFDNWIRIVMIKINRTNLEEQYGQAK